MAYLRVDLRNLIRRELQDTGSPSLWADTSLNDDLAAAFGWYSEYFTVGASASVSSGANQTAVFLGATAVSVDAVTVDGSTVPEVTDWGTLYEPALRSSPSQSYVQPVVPYGAAATHSQVWMFDADQHQVTFRYGLAAGRAIVVHYRTYHVLPADDVTAVTVPDNDVELIVLYACDRLVRSAHTDAIKRGAPGAWGDGREDRGYTARWRSALAARLRHVKSGHVHIDL